MPNRCLKCLTENTDTARFCSNCATSLGPPRDHGPSLKITLELPSQVAVPGTVIAGHYEVLEKMGQGGMGEVYRAIDKNLGRPVAIKVLPAAFAEDKERMARFEREAKLLAVLNHPNIAAIHGLEESEGRRFLILELVEGKTLQARLNRGALPVKEALDTCLELAEGLEAAHEKGIIHRDLKPGNIMITPEGKVKILDFGLAKEYGGETTGVDPEKSPTITAEMTEPGVIMGTAAYMSPEQARGKAVDRRSDIWAFGCVLYECLTGSPAFHGETISDILAHILKGEPDWNKPPAETPTRIRVLLRRCLEKNLRERLHDIADARLEIMSPEATPLKAAPIRRRFSLLLLAVGAVVMLLAGFLTDRLTSGRLQPSSVASVVTSMIKLVPNHWLEGMRAYWQLEHPSRTAMAISSDGQFVVYCAIEENPGPQATSRLYLRRLDRPGALPITGTDGGVNPFLSPDNQWVGFWADNKLKKVPIDGGVASTLCDLPTWPFGAHWGRDNSIVFSDARNAGLSRVSAEGGRPEILTKPDPKRQEFSHRLPFWLPNGKAVLFTATRNTWDSQPWLALLRLDTRDWHVLLQDASDARYVPTGHLVFMRQGTLMAVRFELARLEVVGQPVALVENVMQVFSPGTNYNTGAGQFAISDAGSLIYASGGLAPDTKDSLVWVDQKGREQPVTGRLSAYFAPRLSPDGQRIAYVTSGHEWQVFVYDLARDTHSPLTVEGAANFPIWTPDGRRLLFLWTNSPAVDLFWQPFDGSLPMERLTTDGSFKLAGSWNPDGNTIAIVESLSGSGVGFDIAMLDASSGRVTPFLNSPFDEEFPDFSPDGHWLAYTSNESKRREVYVRAFPGPGIKQQVSSEGGLEPLWAKNGRQLFYRWEGQVWVVDIRTDGGFAIGKPRLLFEKPECGSGYPVRAYDLSLDGHRFLMFKDDQRKPTPVTEMILVQNWLEELKRLVPADKK